MTDTALEIRRFTVRGCYELCEKTGGRSNARPDAFWINTSSNDLVKRLWIKQIKRREMRLKVDCRRSNRKKYPA